MAEPTTERITLAAALKSMCPDDLAAEGAALNQELIGFFDGIEPLLRRITRVLPARRPLHIVRMRAPDRTIASW